MPTAITFPTRPTHHGGRHILNGTPERATPCHCGPDALHIHPHDTCLRCGHHPKPLIDRTWQHRARQIAQPTTAMSTGGRVKLQPAGDATLAVKLPPPA